MNAPPPADAFFPFDNTYARLPDRFFARQQPTPVPAPRLIRLNVPLTTVQKLCGHNDIKTTIRYYNLVSKDDLRAGIEALQKRYG